MKAAVIGAGALGTFYAAMLSRAHDVTLVCRERQAKALLKGISVEGAVSASAMPAIALAAPDCDVYFVMVKAYDIGEAAKGIPRNNAPVIVVHNGLGGDEEARRSLGPGRVAVGLAYCGVTFLETGRVSLAGYTETILGSTEPPAQKMLGNIASMLESSGLRARVADDIKAASWEKLYANVGINAITALTGLENGEVVRLPGLKETALAAVREAKEVSDALGIRVSADPEKLLMKVAEDTARNRSSMLQDIEKGRRTEIGYINAKVCELGKQAGIKTPVNQALAALVQGLEEKK